MTTKQRTQCSPAEVEDFGFQPLSPQQATRVIGGGRLHIPTGSPVPDPDPQNPDPPSTDPALP
ncbi:MAG: hypothetical protein JWM27_2273 [Gemmatimonadetes bacterium]|nr:hypothetical protein [Gemmatimonadota bacterium]